MRKIEHEITINRDKKGKAARKHNLKWSNVIFPSFMASRGYQLVSLTSLAWRSSYRSFVFKAIVSIRRTTQIRSKNIGTLLRWGLAVSEIQTVKLLTIQKCLKTRLFHCRRNEKAIIDSYRSHRIPSDRS